MKTFNEYVGNKKLTENTPFHFDGGHNRHGIIDIRNGTCDICHQNKPVLYGDASEEEYSPIEVCKDCIDRLFHVPAQQTPKINPK